ncbi:MAG: ABC transporter permease [Gemmatimonadetes bacterium]|nr:ABC transporter permease [Gemmatimonadota bacterium]
MSGDSRLVALLGFLYGYALRAFPRSFRDRYAEDMTMAFRSHCEKGRVGWSGVLIRGMQGLWDAFIEGLRERRSARADETGAYSSGGFAARNRVEAITADGRYALRALRRSPGFAAGVVGVLALGIAASVAIFTLLDALVLRGLPFDDPDALVVVMETFQDPGGPLEERSVSYPAYLDWSQRTSAFDALAIRTFQSVALATESGPAAALSVALTSASLRGVLRVGAELGRWFTEGEDAAAARVIVLSHAIWRTRFGADPSIIGRTLSLEGVPFEVVGVAEAGFAGAFGGVQEWVPIRASLAFQPPGSTGGFEARGSRGYLVLGRLRPGIPLAEAQVQVDRITAELHASGALPETRGAQVQSFRARLLGNAGRDAILLFGAAVLVLLIACANVANLMLARLIVRKREIALCRALGAGGGDIVRQSLLESVALGLVGGAAGTALAPLLIRALADANLVGLPAYVVPTVNTGTMLFALAISIGTALVFGAIPAGTGLRVGLLEAMRGSARGSAVGASAGRFTARSMLVVAQLVIAVPLLAGAGLVLKSIARQAAIDPGFDASGTVAAQVSLPATRYSLDGAREFTGRLTAALAQNPRIEGVAAASDIPIQSGYRATIVDVANEGTAPREFRVYLHNVSAGYFELLGMRLLEGRTFDERDATGAPEVVVLSQKAASRFWPGESAVGRTIEGAEVIGVVGDAAFRTLLPDPVGNPDDPDIFLAFAQSPTRAVSLLVRARGSAPDAIARDLEEEVSRLDPALPVQSSTTLTEVLEAQIAASSALARELVLFAIAALLLAAAGLYGIMTYTVSQRAPEIGVRMALGARRGQVLRHILIQGLTLVGIGAATGLLVALAAGRALRNKLYEVSPADPVTYAVVGLTLILTGAIACWVPARRALRVDPVRVLRE